MNRQFWKVAPLVFTSGMCALMYQIAWSRAFRLIFGASTAASAAVVAIFIGGLGLGGFFIGKRAEKTARPLALYAHLEMGIAVSAALTPLLLWLARKAYIAFGGTMALGIGFGSVARLALATLVLAIPTVLMGGTLPALARAVATEEDDGRRAVAALYGTNTLGAVVGCIASNFLMLEIFGTQLTLWIGCLLNLLVGVIARGIARGFAPAEPSAAPLANEVLGARAPRVFILAAAAAVGFAFFLMELVWYRMLGPLLGGTIFTFGLILAVALLGIGIGGAIYPLVYRSGKSARLSGFAITCLLEAALIAIPFAFGDRLAMLALFLRPVGSFGFYGYVFGWTIVAGIVILPAAIVAGVQFPLLIALLGKGRREVARQVGMTYAWNTVGAILGAIAGGFGLIPLLTAPGCWRLVAVLLLVLGVAALALSLLAKDDRSRAERSVVAATGAAVLALAAVLLSSRGPTAAWRHSPIGAGRLGSLAAMLTSPNAIERFLRERRREIVWEAEGVESSVAVDGGNGYAFLVNGKVDGHSRSDAETQVMGGLIGAILHPNPKSAMVIGLGTGSTAGWLGQVPSIDRVDVAELEPAILEVARMCAPVNGEVLENPKVHVTRGDAREVLAVTRKQYDVVFSEPSNPYRAGIASLYTKEYYEAIRDRLTEDGLFLQWVQAYEVDAKTIRTIYATLASVFPSVESWQAKDQDLVLVGSMAPLVHDVARLRATVAAQPFATALRVAWRVDTLEGFFGHFIARPGLAQAIADEEVGLNTDDLGLVEFGFAKSLGRDNAFSTKELVDAARARNESMPLVTGGKVDWERVKFERGALSTVENTEPRTPPDIEPAYRERLQVQAYYVAGNFLGAHSTWKNLNIDPQTPLEQSIVAEVYVNMSDPDSRRLIEMLRPWNATEADGLLAIAMTHEGKLDDAAATFEKAFSQFRTDPWPLNVVMYRVLLAAQDLATRAPHLAARVLAMLKEPFVLRSLDTERLNVIVAITKKQGDLASCVDALAPYEPNTPWTLDHLSFRAECYERHNPALASLAARELERFKSRQPFELRPGIY